MIADPLHSLLRQLEPPVLRELVGEGRLATIEPVIADGGGASIEQDATALATLLLIMHGTHLLEDSRVRSHLLATIAPDELRRLADELAGQSSDKPADNVLALAALPWRPAAPIALEFVQRFDLPVSY